MEVFAGKNGAFCINSHFLFRGVLAVRFLLKASEQSLFYQAPRWQSFVFIDAIKMESSLVFV